MRFLFYSHDGLGLGHTRRHLAVAAALVQLAPESAVLLVTGADEVGRLGLPPNIDVLKLPGLRKVTNDQYVGRRLQLPISEIRSLRSALLETAVKSYRPAVVLVDKHPFGAKGEFRAGLDELKAAGGRAVLGLRDILDDRVSVLNEWAPSKMQDRIAEFYDLVLVYGERSVFDPIAEYDLPNSVAERSRFCGYVVNRDEAEVRMDIRWSALTLENRTRPVVLATTGGGEDGFALLETFLRAAAGAPWQGIAVAGPMTPDHEFKTLQRMSADSNVHLYAFVPNLSGLFWSVDALVCMGGYNTLTEAVSKGLPIICVPRTSLRSEQLIRALAFEKLGLLRTIKPELLSAEILSREVSSVLARSRQELLGRAKAVLSFDGARQAASHLLALASSQVVAPPVQTDMVGT